jgi:hypothetical protein
VIAAAVSIASSEPAPIAPSTPRRPLTMRQQVCLDFIASYTQKQNSPPPMRDIGRHLGIRSNNGVHDYLVALERKGHIRRLSAIARGVVIVAGGAPSSIPHVHEIDLLRAENVALRHLLERVRDASSRSPTLTAEIKIVLGDVRDVLRTPRAGGMR